MERESSVAAESLAVPEADQPGLAALREAVRNRRWIRLPKAASLRSDVIAGLSSAISNVPDGMANGALVGVSPVHGLYGTMAGPAVGGVLASTHLMMITTMAAASLAAAQALAHLQGQARLDGLFALVLLVGAFQVAAGWLHLGKLVRFVSYSVTTGFLSGVSVLLILNQLPIVTGRDRRAASPAQSSSCSRPEPFSGPRLRWRRSRWAWPPGCRSPGLASSGGFWPSWCLRWPWCCSGWTR